MGCADDHYFNQANSASFTYLASFWFKLTGIFPGGINRVNVWVDGARGDGSGSIRLNLWASVPTEVGKQEYNHEIGNVMPKGIAELTRMVCGAPDARFLVKPKLYDPPIGFGSLPRCVSYLDCCLTVPSLGNSHLCTAVPCIARSIHFDVAGRDGRR